jgi:hypothetical protein
MKITYNAITGPPFIASNSTGSNTGAHRNSNTNMQVARLGVPGPLLETPYIA